MFDKISTVAVNLAASDWNSSLHIVYNEGCLQQIKQKKSAHVTKLFEFLIGWKPHHRDYDWFMQKGFHPF